MKKNIFRFLPILGFSVLIACQSTGTDTNNQESDNHQSETAITDNQSENSVEKTAVLTLEEDSFDFGTVKEGEKVEHEFIFSNTGEAPLILSNVQASCGCTTPDYSRNPIQPGEKGMVKVVFDSKGQQGNQHKIITVTANTTTPNTLLHLRGEVKK